MNFTMTELGRVAGFLEGEGSFCRSTKPENYRA
jgi:hypothetical protein